MLGFAVQRRGVKTEKPSLGIGNFQLVSQNLLTVVTRARQFRQIEIGEITFDGVAFGSSGLEAE